ncbi:hypothetical protein BC937DRAFT_95508 [Endogone sp. FLAS-F59071]|nr:hypothetical protein BC937DRAFT_95508 [Endogone sp. FLAS-F59071]|eukprot:RUS13318.1 hypothetical protein BC937DRAFT_95508 [Endogone sp. FLAS-F59071]
MADPFCFALLKIAALQISHAAGFEAANSGPANLLTDVFARYLSLLASTAKHYSELAGRDTANACDLAHGLMNLGVDVEQLREWVEQGDARALQPTWNERTDPSPLLHGILSSGRPQRNPKNDLVYTYGDVSPELLRRFENSDEYGTRAESESEGDELESENEAEMNVGGLWHDRRESKAGATNGLANGNHDKVSSPTTSSSPPPVVSKGGMDDESKDTLNNHQDRFGSIKRPAYVPEHLPPFPTEKDFAEAKQSNPATVGSSSATVLLSLEPLPPSPSTTQPKAKKKTVSENPFTHIVPYNESSLAQGKRDELLGVDVPSHGKGKRKHREVTSAESRGKSAPSNDSLLERALASVSQPDAKRRRFYAPPTALGSVSAPDASRNIAAPPDTLFTGTFVYTGLIDTAVRQVATAALLSRLNAPNLVEPPTPVSATVTVPLPPVPEPPSATASGSKILLNGIPVPSSAAGNPVTSSQLKKSSLAPMSLAKASSASLGLALTSKGKTVSPPPKIKTKKPPLTLNLADINANRTREFAAPLGSASPTKSGGMATPSSATSLPTPIKKITFTVKTPDPAAPPPSPFRSTTPASSSRKANVEEKKPAKKKAVPPLPPPPPPPPRPRTPPAPLEDEGLPDEDEAGKAEEINCVCSDQPHVDDGGFMVACDNCEVWFHGRCVGVTAIAEDEKWFCPRCKTKGTVQGV